MRRTILFLTCFLGTLVALDRTDNPPPGVEELHVFRTQAALTAAQAQVDRTRLLLSWPPTSQPGTP